MAFLPEKEVEEEAEDEEEEDDDDDEEESAQRKAEWAAYMESFVQVASASGGRGAGASRKGAAHAGGAAVLLPRTVRRTPRVRNWKKVLLLNGLESRAAAGSCKLRFVCRSEDVWYAPRKRKSAGGDAGAKRPKLEQWLEAQLKARGEAFKA